MSGSVLEGIRNSIVDLKFEEEKASVQQALSAGVSPLKILDEMAKAMEIVGQKFEASEYFLSELIVAADVMKEGLTVLDPHLKGKEVKKLGTVVIGTVRGDLHEIGKNVVVMLLEAAGFKVIDLGVDVAPEAFVDAVAKNNAQIVGLSALLTSTMNEMGNIIQSLKRSTVRGQVKVIIGGAPITEEFAKRIGADAYARDAVEGVRICKSFVGA